MTKLMVVFRNFANAPEKGKMAAFGCVFYIPGPLFCCEVHMCRAEVNSCTWFPWYYSLLKKNTSKIFTFPDSRHYQTVCPCIILSIPLPFITLEPRCALCVQARGDLKPYAARGTRMVDSFEQYSA
jgi:hypothetical protein